MRNIKQKNTKIKWFSLLIILSLVFCTLVMSVSAFEEVPMDILNGRTVSEILDTDYIIVPGTTREQIANGEYVKASDYYADLQYQSDINNDEELTELSENIAVAGLFCGCIILMGYILWADKKDKDISV